MAAAEDADWQNTPGYSVVLTDQSGKNAWPIAGATFILVYKNPASCKNSKAVLEFFNWAYESGAEMAKSLDYVPMPRKVSNIMKDTWAKEIRCNDKAVWNK